MFFRRSLPADMAQNAWYRFMVKGLRTRRKFRTIVIVTCLLCVVVNVPWGTTPPGLSSPQHTFAWDLDFFDNVVTPTHSSGHRQMLIVQVSKESSPIASFGGVGQVVGDIAKAHGSAQHAIPFVILPRYKFIQGSRSLARFHFTHRLQVVEGSLEYYFAGDVNFILVGSPSHVPKLWASANIEDAYNCPKRMRPEERDLYFSFVASKIVERLHKNSNSAVIVHAHGATNAPVLMFSKQSLAFEVRTVYTMHDYDSEPWVTYSASKIVQYQGNTCPRQLTTRQGRGYACHTPFTPVTPPECLTSRSVGAAYFVSCADYITTVSSGMLNDLLHSNEYLATLILSYMKEERIFPVLNWVSPQLWDTARSIISLKEPSVGKLRARRHIGERFPFLASVLPERNDFSELCVVGWMGRFEKNKGLFLLPAIFEATCEAGCALIIAGYSTNSKMRKQQEHIFEQLKIMSRHMSCPLLSLQSKADHVEERDAIRASIDLMVIPSEKEAFGLVAAEALAFGSMPIVSLVGGLPEVISSYQAGSSSWTGIEFPSFPNSLALTSLAVKSAIFQAVNLLLDAQKSSRLDELHRRLIMSTPVGNLRRSSDPVLAYRRVYFGLNNVESQQIANISIHE